MVGEILHGIFTLKNNSEIDLQYGISLLSEKSDVVQAFSGPSEIGMLRIVNLSFPTRVLACAQREIGAVPCRKHLQ